MMGKNGAYCKKQTTVSVLMPAVIEWPVYHKHTTWWPIVSIFLVGEQSAHSRQLDDLPNGLIYFYLFLKIVNTSIQVPSDDISWHVARFLDPELSVTSNHVFLEKGILLIPATASSDAHSRLWLSLVA